MSSFDPMTSSHTPGPWHLVHHRPNLFKVETNTAVICDAFGGLSNETMANARLIASAPELLLALEQLLETAESLNDWLVSDGSINGEHELFQKVRTIISKAKGIQ